MLKTVSSIANSIGALNYKGTWNASTNSPTLTSGAGTKGDYYVVSVAGSTSLDGISNWGIGDWAVYNGSVWQRVEGGADLNGVNLTVSGNSTLGPTVAYSFAVSANQNIITGGMWYQTSGGLLVFTPASSGGFAWNNYANNAQVASLSDAGALTIKNNFLLDGAGNPQHIVKTSGAGNNPVYRLQFGSDYWDIQGTGSNAGKELYLIYSGNARGYFNSATGAYVPVSDRRLKKNIDSISYGLAAVMALRPVEYLMNNESDDAQKHLGFIAQEALEVIPSSVSEMLEGILGMDKGEIIPVLVKAIQEQQAAIDQLKAEIQTLKGV